MPVCVSLLRGINVGGRNLIPMAGLAELYESLGMTAVTTLLQSGNVLFCSRSRATAATLARQLRGGIEERFAVRAELYLRSPEELRTALTANPFREEAESDPSHLIIHFFDGLPVAGATQTLAAWDRGSERLRLVGANLYIYYPEGLGRSKLTGAILDRALGCSGTARNWNTVNKLAALSAALE